MTEKDMQLTRFWQAAGNAWMDHYIVFHYTGVTFIVSTPCVMCYGLHAALLLGHK